LVKTTNYVVDAIIDIWLMSAW